MMLKTCTVAVVLAILSFKTSVQDFASFLEDFNTVTGKTYLFVGDTLELTCVLNDDFLQNYTANNIIFKFQFQGRGEVKCVPASSVEVVGIDKARLVIHNVSLNDAGPYGCYVANAHCDDVAMDDLGFVGISDDVKVEYAPRNVINFQCVVFNWDAMMICTWQHPVEYVTESNIEVATSYSIPKQSPQYYKCPEQSFNGCKWNEASFISTYSYTIAVTVRNIITNTTTTSIFNVDPFYSVKPDPVENLAISVLEGHPDCFVLSWTHSRKWRDKIYRIKHSSRKDRMFNVLIDNLASTNYTACGYLPYTYYNFSVECFPYYNVSVESYPTFVNSGNWSDPEYISARTPMTAPSVGPQIANGCFTTTPCVNGRRNVTVMWQEVEESAQNGVIDGYVVKLEKTYLATVAKGVYSATVELPCDSTSVLTILAHNEGGYSLEPSVLHVPSATVTVPKKVQDSFSVEIMSGQSSSEHKASIRALWEGDTETEVMNYIIFWCRGLPGQSCMGPIQWFHVAGTQTSYDIPVPISDAGEYLYGISVTYSITGLIPGIFWTGCLFSHNPSIMHQRVTNLKLDSGTNEVQVSWVQIPCTYQSLIKVTNYTVKWCQSNRCNKTDDVISYTVPAKEFMYTVSELTADVKYSFTVQPRSYGDVGDEVKPWKVAVPVGQESSTKILPIVVGIFVILIILLIAIVLVYWRCYKGKHKTKKLKFEEFFTLENTPSQSKLAAANNARNGTGSLLPQSDIPSCSSSDSECDIVPVSPERTTASQELIDSPQQDERVVQESASSNPESIQSYQHVAYSPISQSSEPSSNRDECVEYSDSASNEPYQRVACSQSNQPSDVQIDLEDVREEEDDTEEQPTMSILDFINRSITQEATVPDTLRAVVVTPVTSPVLQHISVTLNAGAGENVDAPPDHHTLSDLTNVSSLAPDASSCQSHMSQANTETLTQHNTSDTSSNSGASCSTGNYTQMGMIHGQHGADFSSSS